MKHLHILATFGFAMAVVAVISGDPRAGWLAIAILLAYLIVRLVQRNRSPGHREDAPEGEEDA